MSCYNTCIKFSYLRWHDPKPYIILRSTFLCCAMSSYVSSLAILLKEHTAFLAFYDSGIAYRQV